MAAHSTQSVDHRCDNCEGIDPASCMFNTEASMATFATEREDFKTAAAAFHARGTPSVAEIEKTLWHLIANVKKNGSGSCGTGRLYAEAGEDGDVHLSMDLGTLEGFLTEQEGS